MPHKIQQDWSLFAVLGLFLTTLGCLLVLTLRQNEGHVVYALDDAYIHMAIAKHFALDGVWGVTPFEFSSSSSSLLWPLLLSLLYRLFGVNESSPLILNTLFATGLIIISYSILRKYALPQPIIFCVLTTMVFLAPLPTLVFIGMEHVLHILLTVGLSFAVIEILLEKNGSSQIRWILLGAPLLTATRFEGIFLILTSCALFSFKRKFRLAFFLGAYGLFPILAYGLYSVAQGWYFFPNSIALKGHFPTWNSFGDIIYSLGYSGLATLNSAPYILWLVIVISLIVIDHRVRHKENAWNNVNIVGLVFIFSTLLHMQFVGRVNSFYRYDAYIVVLGLLSVAVTAPPIAFQKYRWTIKTEDLTAISAGLIVSLIILAPLGDRVYSSLRNTPQATTNIFQQQYQMGLFLAKFYPGETIAANDIGAINYLADIRNIDLWALGTLEMAHLKLNHTYTSKRISELCADRQVKIAIIYDAVFAEAGGIPPAWIKVGTWKISNNVVAGYDTVSFFAVMPSETNSLLTNLRTFSAQLPKQVTYTLY